ncbi:hypothetical protein D3C74_257000 [compost metagenome]
MPTQIIKLNGYFFVVDCFQHRVIYSNDLSKEIKDWNVIDYEFAGPHSIASDGDIYVVDNAGRNEILVFDASFRRVQTISGVGIRPHKTIYTNNRFYSISSQTATIYCYQKIGGVLVEEYHKTLDFIESNYIRSIKMIDGKMHFVIGNNLIVVANHLSGNFEVLESYSLVGAFAGLIDIEKFNGEFYISAMGDSRYNIPISMTKAISLNDYVTGTYQNIYDQQSMEDIPYFMYVGGDKMYFTEAGETQNSVLSIDTNGNKTIYHSFLGLLPGSIKRRETYPR